MHLDAVSSTFTCDAILFDLDGVLVDSAEVVERTWRRWAARYGLDPVRVVGTAHGRRTIETVRLLAPHLAAEDEVAALAASESTETDGVREVPGARELIASLPVGSWAVVTSGIRPVAELRIRHTRLPSPPVLVTADQVTRGKPDPMGADLVVPVLSSLRVESSARDAARRLTVLASPLPTRSPPRSTTAT